MVALVGHVAVEVHPQLGLAVHVLEAADLPPHAQADLGDGLAVDDDLGGHVLIGLVVEREDVLVVDDELDPVDAIEGEQRVLAVAEVLDLVRDPAAVLPRGAPPFAGVVVRARAVVARTGHLLDRVPPRGHRLRGVAAPRQPHRHSLQYAQDIHALHRVAAPGNLPLRGRNLVPTPLDQVGGDERLRRRVSSTVAALSCRWGVDDHCPQLKSLPTSWTLPSTSKLRRNNSAHWSLHRGLGTATCLRNAFQCGGVSDFGTKGRANSKRMDATPPRESWHACPASQPGPRMPGQQRGLRPGAQGSEARAA